MDEIVRPRPQGSSPVYECAAESPGFGLPVSLLDRGPQAEGRLAWGCRRPRLLLRHPVGVCPCPAAHRATAAPPRRSSLGLSLPLAKTQLGWPCGCTWEPTPRSCVQRGHGVPSAEELSSPCTQQLAGGSLPLSWGPLLPKALPCPGLQQPGNPHVSGCRKTQRAGRPPRGGGDPGGSDSQGTRRRFPG